MSRSGGVRESAQATTRLPPEVRPSVKELYAHRRFDKKPNPETGVAICTRCHAISTTKHWYTDPHQLERLAGQQAVHATLCPGCTRVDRRYYEGQVVLDSPLVAKNKDMIMALIKHTEGKAWHDNPLSRIASISEEGNRMEILTTTRWLASRIGKQLHKALKGTLEIKPAPRERFIRVYWSHP